MHVLRYPLVSCMYMYDVILITAMLVKHSLSLCSNLFHYAHQVYILSSVPLQVASIRLVGILLVVFAESSVADHISEVDVDTVATGILGQLVSLE